MNGFDRSILETSAKMGRVIFMNFVIYRLNWKHIHVTCTDLPEK